ncbi:hypothetical protein O9992_22150 [Vibrio lentus]|nr:hypothetical protein [Vibrio lentus]
MWIGVQFSVATALNLAGKSRQAETLMDTVYTALYDCYSKIPFAAPEGSIALCLSMRKIL